MTTRDTVGPYGDGFTNLSVSTPTTTNGYHEHDASLFLQRRVTALNQELQKARQELRDAERKIHRLTADREKLQELQSYMLELLPVSNRKIIEGEKMILLAVLGLFVPGRRTFTTIDAQGNERQRKIQFRPDGSVKLFCSWLSCLTGISTRSVSEHVYKLETKGLITLDASEKIEKSATFPHDIPIWWVRLESSPETIAESIEGHDRGRSKKCASCGETDIPNVMIFSEREAYLGTKREICKHCGDTMGEYAVYARIDQDGQVQQRQEVTYQQKQEPSETGTLDSNIKRLHSQIARAQIEQLGQDEETQDEPLFFHEDASGQDAVLSPILLDTVQGLGVRCAICKTREALSYWIGGKPYCLECKLHEQERMSKEVSR